MIFDLMSSLRPLSGRARLAVCVVIGMTLVGCSGGDKKDKPATQTAARVNKEEITVHQINFALSQQRAIPPAQAASASKQVLEKLIDQELAVQKAAEQKIDRDPRVQQQIEFARREIIARAYFDKIGAGAPKPTPEEIHAYYEQNPALFRERRIYGLQEIAIEASPQQVDQLRVQMQTSKNMNEFIEYLKANKIKFAGNQVVRPAEQLPLPSLPVLSRMKEGQTIFNRTPSGVQVIVLVSARSQPIDEDRARPAIEQFLQNERKRKVVEDDLKALRAASKIEYVGNYQKTAAQIAADQKAALDVKPSVSALTGAQGASAIPIEPVKDRDASPLIGKPASEVEAIVPVQPASIPSGSALDKGLKGLK